MFVVFFSLSALSFLYWSPDFVAAAVGLHSISFVFLVSLRSDVKPHKPINTIFPQLWLVLNHCRIHIHCQNTFLAYQLFDLQPNHCIIFMAVVKRAIYRHWAASVLNVNVNHLHSFQSFISLSYRISDKIHFYSKIRIKHISVSNRLIASNFYCFPNHKHSFYALTNPYIWDSFRMRMNKSQILICI